MRLPKRSLYINPLLYSKLHGILCIVTCTHWCRPFLGYYWCCSPWGNTYASQWNNRSEEKDPKYKKMFSIVIIYCFLKALIFCDFINLLLWLKSTLFLSRLYTKAKQNNISMVVKQQKYWLCISKTYIFSLWMFLRK